MITTTDEIVSVAVDGQAMLSQSWLYRVKASPDQQAVSKAVVMCLPTDTAFLQKVLSVLPSCYMREGAVMADQKMTASQLASVLPADIVAQAEKVGVDAKDLLKLCVDHTVEAARSWLAMLASKLPGGGAK